MAKRLELLIVSEPLAGKRYAITADGLRLGRSSSNDIHVPDEELSRNHCLFEPVGETGIRLTDLASANGTFLNGKPLGDDPIELKEGDTIVVGKTTLKIVGDQPPPPPPPPPKVDLQLGGDSATQKVGSRQKHRSPLANALWAVVVLLGAVAVVLVLLQSDANAPDLAPVVEEDPVVREAWYEKVEANSEGIFRYEMTLSADGTLKVGIDDVPKENRHITKSAQLSETALKEISDILSWKTLKEIDREYAGVEPDPPALTSWSLKVVYDRRVRRVRITNTQEPEAFRSLREKLEAFSKNELGIWAIQYSRDKLVALATEAIELGRVKWEDRDAAYGNLAASVAAYREATFYLETVDPKPDCIREAREGLERATAELNTRYNDKRFEANRAINLGQWDEASRTLGILLEMVPDRNDDRNREASVKLMDVDKRKKERGR